MCIYQSFGYFFMIQLFLQRSELVVNINNSNHGKPPVVSEESVTTAESQIKGYYFIHT